MGSTLGIKNNSIKDYRIWLIDEFSQRRVRNSFYSLRAFARDLGVSPTSLSEVLAKKRDFSKKNILQISNSMSLSPLQTNSLLAQVGLKSNKELEKREFFELSEDSFRVISDWYHLAIVNLCKMNSRNNIDVNFVAKRLSISKIEAQNAIARLLRLKLIKREGKTLKVTTTTLSTTRDVPSTSIRKYHKQNLQLAEKSIERDSVDLREFSSITFPTDLARLDEAKGMIMDFKRKMARFLETSNSKEVYTLAIQLFPISRSVK